jgi:hypothetical protein
MMPMENQPTRRSPAADGSQGVDPSRMRISDEDRHRVSEVLRRAAGEGRIDMAELDERLEATYQAKTYGDLVPLTADLPTAAGQAPSAAPFPQPLPQPDAHPAGYSTSVAVMSTSRRTGAWTVEDGHTAFALMGSVLLDLRDAHVGSREITINASAVMGDVKVVVGAGTQVVVDGFGIMGEFSEQRPKVPFDASVGGPLVRVRGIALMGSVHVQRKGRPGAGMLRRPGS